MKPPQPPPLPPPPPKRPQLPPELPPVLLDGHAIVAAPGPLTLRRVAAHASNYSAHPRLSPRLIVIHATDGHEGVNKDTDVAAMFAAPLVPPQKPRSAHYIVDSDSVTRCVPDLMTAWHSGRHGNQFGIGIEFCGGASQSRAEWFDELSLPMLCLGARLISDLCRLYQIPPVVVNDRMLLQGHAGITTHSFVSEAWKESSHHDPGVGFPLGSLVMAVQRDLLLTA